LKHMLLSLTRLEVYRWLLGDWAGSTHMMITGSTAKPAVERKYMIRVMTR
jgi:hypothetical protein